ncbi:MAG: hypothetical protein GX597_15105 [Anaerolineaceae bacterium]|nr:hypothetical protein [Anaerolineaceae bacterium]
MASLCIGWASILIGLSAGYLRLLAVLTTGLLLLALATFRLQSEQVAFGLFKCASMYMLGGMAILVLSAFGARGIGFLCRTPSSQGRTMRWKA